MTSAPWPEGVVAIPLPTPFAVPDINVYLIQSDPPILVDAGPNMAEAYDKLVTGLRGHGYALSDIAAVLVTHDHIDHTGMLGQVLAEAGAEAYAHPDAKAQLADYDGRADASIGHYEALLTSLGAHGAALRAALDDWRDDRQYGAGAQVEHPINNGDTLFGYRVHYVPGHSATDLLFEAEDGSHAFSGDHLLKSINPNPLLRITAPGAPRRKSLVELRASLRRTATIDTQRVLPGHGESMTDHKATIERLQKRYDRKNNDVHTFLANGPLTAYQVSKAMFPNLEDKHLFLGMSVALGHLEDLEERGRARSETRENVLVYHAG